MISVVSQLYNAARYDAITEPHHHIVCLECKKIEDVYEDCADYTKLDNKIPDYEVVGFSVLFHGICPQCAES